MDLPDSTFAFGLQVTHSEAEWKELLTPAQYTVLRKAGTERPRSSPLNSEKRDGVFK
jgi:peptide-methionine (R)-S-oxide reductase